MTVSATDATTVTTAPPQSTLTAFGTLWFAYFAAVGLFNPYAPLWFQSLGFSTVVIGLIASLQSWTRVLAPYAWGWFGDHSGRRVELIRLAAALALCFALLMSGLPWLSVAVLPVALVTAALFLVNGGVVPLAEATLAQALHNDAGVDAAKYGRVRVWGSVGFIVAVLAFGALLEGVGIQAFPAFVAAMYALLVLAAWRLPPSRADVVHAEAAPALLPLLRQPVVAWFFASAFFTVLAHTSLYAFFSLYLVHLGFGKAAVGALWAVSVAAEIVFFWFQGHWFKRLSPHAWLQCVGWVTALRFAVTAGAGLGGVFGGVFGGVLGSGGASALGTAWLVLAQLSHAITFATHHTACIGLVHTHFPGRLRGRGQALYSMLGYGLPGVVGGVAGGWLIDHSGYAAVFWAAAGAGVAAALCARRAGALYKSAV